MQQPSSWKSTGTSVLSMGGGQAPEESSSGRHISPKQQQYQDEGTRRAPS